jgi:endoglucanase
MTALPFRRRAAALSLLLTMLVIAGGISGTSTPAQAGTTRANVFTGGRLYVDPNSAAAHGASIYQTSSPLTAAMLSRVAQGATVDWITGSNSTSTVASTVASRSATIHTAGAVPVFVAYNIPHRDCGSYSSGGAAAATSYKAWIDAFAAGLGSGPAAVVLEPDALAQLRCLPGSLQTERLALLRYATATLSAQPGIAVYIDAGHSGWIPASTMASRLRSAGLQWARGFSLNVSFFDTTRSELAYGRSISSALGSVVHFVIDTSRNGQGIAPNRAWCNPSGRGLGMLPTILPTTSILDAVLWIKHPGYSDGTCNGGPAAGQWWTSYARTLGANARLSG